MFVSSATSVTSCVAYCLPFWVHPGLLVAFVLVCFMCMLCRSLLVRLYLFFWPLCFLVFFDIRILFTSLISFGHCAVCSSSIYGFWLLIWYLLLLLLDGCLSFVFWPLWCLFFFDIRILFTSLISFGHCAVCSSSIYGFWLLIWYLLLLLLDGCLSFVFWPLCCLFFFDIRILFTSLVSSNSSYPYCDQTRVLAQFLLINL